MLRLTIVKRNLFIAAFMFFLLPIQAQQQNVGKIACIGASITQGVTLQNPNEAYPQLLQQKLGAGCTVINYGASGSTMLRKGDVSYWNTGAYKAALQSNPSIVFIDLGGNDSKLVNRVHLDEFEKDCSDMVQSFKQLPSHPRVVLLLPLPAFTIDTSQITDAVITSRIIPLIRKVAFDKNVELLDMHSLFVDKAALMPDSFHPNVEGSHIISQRLYELLSLHTDPSFSLLKQINKPADTISYFGYKQASFTVHGKNCIVVEPKIAAANHPFIWRARFWGHEPQTEIALLERGFSVVFCDVAELFGNDEAITAWNAFYNVLHNAGLNQKAVLEGMSRGAVYALNWAAVNPNKVACVYIDNPLLDLRMWPAGLGSRKASGLSEEMKAFKADFHLQTETDIQNFHGSPIDKIDAIAKGNYPILILSADSDEALNPAENALLFQEKMKAVGGKVYVVNKPGFHHHPHSLPNPTLIVDFINQFAGQVPDYKNTKLEAKPRINDLLSKMTLEEKVSQMMNNSPAIDRLNIPTYNWWNEALHGVARSSLRSTVFPQAIALAATFDTAAMYKTADIISTEARAMHSEFLRRGEHGIYEGLTFWTPNINIFRDPRWGRGQETYGEDPYLTGMIGSALVKGFQGNDPTYVKITACAKHYAVHSGPESVRHSFDVKVSDYDLNDTYLPAFKKLVVDAKVASVMCAYNAYGGQPCCGNNLLMTHILYDKWKFRGYVTSDCGAVDDFYRGHKTSPNAEEASSDAVIHGTDVECGESYRSLVAAVQHGLIKEEKIDTALFHLLEIRFRLGMFDPDAMVAYSRIPMTEVESKSHLQQALEMAKKSIVLLKNEKQILPLKTSIKKIAVLGPNADNEETLLGNYSGTPSSITTVLEGIKAKLGSSVEVYYNKATDFVSDTSEQVINSIVDSIKDADVIVYVGGISPSLEGEEMPVKVEGFSGGDRTSIDLPKVQTAFLKKLSATGKPVVFVMMAGSAMSIPWEAEHLPAIVDAWYGGEEAGTAVADVLFGDYNPAGRLPVTFYRSLDQLPPFTDYNMTGRTYRYFTGKPLYAFGYGLSYTTFAYSGIKVVSETAIGDTITLSVNVKNTGNRAGDEVPQLYLTHTNVQSKTPVRALEGFTRIHLKAGETKTVTFRLSPAQLSVVKENGDRVEAPGNIQVYIGGGQPVAGALNGVTSSIILKGKAVLIDSLKQ